MNKLFFLIGFMGAGKTTLGRAVADELGFTFLDLDDLIEKREEKSVREIFETHGEAYFREVESALLKSLTFLPAAQYIIATGGGTPCFEDNMKWMKANGTVIYLQPSVEELSARLYQEMDKRPLLKGLEMADIQDFTTDLLQKREPFYTQAHHRISGENLVPKSLISMLKHPSEL